MINNTLNKMHRLAGIKSDITNESFNRFKNIKKLLKENINELKEEVVLWHGSPYEFKKFSSQKIGTGEGAQAFGWGLYFTDSKSIAKNYAEKLADTSEIENWLESDDARGDFGDYIGDLYNKGGISALKEKFPNQATLNKDENGEFYEVKYGDYVVAANYISDNHKLAKETAENRAFKILNKIKNAIDKSRNIYEVTLHKGKTPDQYTWLEWDKPISDSNRGKINSQFEKENLPKEVSSSSNKTMRLLGYKTDYKTYRPNPISDNAEYFYNSLVIYFLDKGIKNPIKEASLFLLRAGIDGIKYPAESIAKGKTSDNAEAFNYVVFDENAITIEKHDMFEENNINEKWSLKYKRSIDCKHPKGFSQKAHCKGRLKEEEINEPKELIKKAHDSITRIKGKDYAPNVHEIQKWIDKYKK